MTRKVFRLIFVLILVLGSVAISSPQPARAAGLWYVDTTGDDNNDCLSPVTPCATINAAIERASTGDSIKVGEGTYTGSDIAVVSIDKDITLAGGWDVSFGTQSGTSTIDGQGVRRGIVIFSGSVVIGYFTIQNGFADFNTGGGAGIINSSALILSNSIVRNNESESTGGGIWSRGTLTVNNSIISDNSTGSGGSGGGGGGGIENWSGGTVILNNSTVSGNIMRGDFSGSGIHNFGTLTLNNSTVSGNIAAIAIHDHSGGTTTLNNSTVSGNMFGGISKSSGALFLNNTTITDNNFGISLDIAASATLQNSIIAKNINLDCFGTIISSGYNLIGNTFNCNFTPSTGDLTNINPNLGQLIALSDSPGYHPLLSGSPAIDAGNPTGCTDQDGNLLTTDQRGVARVGTCDIGAYEYTTPGPAARLSVIGGNNQRTP
jgi:hypothetical protein